MLFIKGDDRNMKNKKDSNKKYVRVSNRTD